MPKVKFSMFLFFWTAAHATSQGCLTCSEEMLPTSTYMSSQMSLMPSREKARRPFHQETAAITFS